MFTKSGKYILIMVLGVAGGLLGEEIGVQLISRLPKGALLSGFTVIDFIPLAVSFLPFQYRAISVSVTDTETRAIDSLSGRLLVTALVIFLLSGVYYAFIKIQGKLQKTRRTKGQGTKGDRFIFAIQTVLSNRA